MRARVLVVLLVVGAVFGPQPADAAAVCTWGGTPDAQTATFTVDPGLRYEPSTVDLAFTATGELAGDDTRCDGTMSFSGVLRAPASCRFFLNEGTVDGPAGIATYMDAGTTDSQGLLFDADGGVVGTFNALVIPTLELVQQCASTGVTSGTFSSVVVLT